MKPIPINQANFYASKSKYWTIRDAESKLVLASSESGDDFGSSLEESLDLEEVRALLINFGKNKTDSHRMAFFMKTNAFGGDEEDLLMMMEGNQPRRGQMYGHGGVTVEQMNAMFDAKLAKLQADSSNKMLEMQMQFMQNSNKMLLAIQKQQSEYEMEMMRMQMLHADELGSLQQKDGFTFDKLMDGLAKLAPVAMGALSGFSGQKSEEATPEKAAEQEPQPPRKKMTFKIEDTSQEAVGFRMGRASKESHEPKPETPDLLAGFEEDEKARIQALLAAMKSDPDLLTDLESYASSIEYDDEKDEQP